jgi:hypothetical protein
VAAPAQADAWPAPVPSPSPSLVPALYVRFVEAGVLPGERVANA